MERGYCLDEKEYDAESPEGAGHRGKQQRRGGEEATEWAQELEDFQIPVVSETYFLDGCKVRPEVSLEGGGSRRITVSAHRFTSPGSQMSSWKNYIRWSTLEVG